MDLSARLSDITRQRYGLDAAQCDDTQRYHALLQLTQDQLPLALARRGDICAALGADFDPVALDLKPRAAST